MEKTGLGFVTDLFCDLTRYDTRSLQDMAQTPSTPGQMAFAARLADICAELGLDGARFDEHGYVFAELPANADGRPVIGFLAHTDTSHACSGKDVKPLITRDYRGGDIVFPNGGKLSPADFPSLTKFIGQDLITASGGTLLGADDKAGIAAILGAAVYLSEHPEIKHGALKFCFPPDEEIGHGAELLDLEAFGADFAYTVDGGELGEFEFECFNAARAVVTVEGVSTHPGTAKGVMVNSAKIAAEMALAFPQDEAPETTADREGYYHVDSLSGNVEKTVIDMILRDFDKEGLERRKDFTRGVVSEMNERYGGVNRVGVVITDQYSNMAGVFDGNRNIIDLALNAYKACGIEPITRPIRGGTDGARLSLRGLPCPNIFTGGHNAHGPFEFVSAGDMDKCRDVLVKIAEGA